MNEANSKVVTHLNVLCQSPGVIQNRENSECGHLRARPVFGNVTNKLNDVSRVKDRHTGFKDDNFSHRRRKHSPEVFIENPVPKQTNLKPLVEPKIRRSDVKNNEIENFQRLKGEVHKSDFLSKGHITKETTIGQSTPRNIIDIPKKPASVIAFDVVRAAFTKRISLEDFLMECRCADFSFAAMNRSPVARMLEGTDYVIGIMAYEQSRELKLCFQLEDFIANGRQSALTPDMVTTLADWMVEVQENFAFNHETIHLAWGLLYAFLSQGLSIARREIQLLACAAIMVACKHEERQMPPMNEFLYITDNAYTRDEFIEAEQRLLTCIDFNVHRPNPYVFLRRYARVLDAHNGTVQFMSRFLLEAGMHSHSINLCRESLKAAAVLWLARRVLRNPSYSDWLRRPEIANLQRSVKTDLRLQAFYNNCPSSTALTCKNASDANVLVDAYPLAKPTLLRSRSDSAATQKRPFIPLGTPREHPCDNENRNSVACQKAASCVAPSSPTRTTNPHLVNSLRCMRVADAQRRPLWPPILQHITGYEERELIPLALQYHRIALRLLAEVARGGRLEEAGTAQSDATVVGEMSFDATSGPGDCCEVIITFDDANSCGSDTRANQRVTSTASATAIADTQMRCTSPGGHQLRRQVVTKYCSASFLSVADAYPQFSFENLIPDFPEINCPDDCNCFVCSNLVRPEQICTVADIA